MEADFVMAKNLEPLEKTGSGQTAEAPSKEDKFQFTVSILTLASSPTKPIAIPWPDDFGKTSWIPAIAGSYNSRLQYADRIIKGLGITEDVIIHDATFDGGRYCGVRCNEESLQHSHVLSTYWLTKEASLWLGKVTGLSIQAVSDGRRTQSSETRMAIMRNPKKLIGSIEKNRADLGHVKSIVYEITKEMTDDENYLKAYGRVKLALVSPSMFAMKADEAWSHYKVKASE